MLKSLQILILGMMLAAPMALGQLGSLSDYDGVLQAKFAFRISEAEPEADSQGFTLTSSSLIREYALPGKARVYWVMDFDGPLIEGGLVVADSETGKIHSLIAEATQTERQESLDGNGADDGDWMAANFVLYFDIDGLEFTARAPMQFQFIQGRNISFLRMTSAGELIGQGVFDHESRL